MTKVEQLKIESFDLIAAQDALSQQQNKVKSLLEEKLKELNAALGEEQKATAGNTAEGQKPDGVAPQQPANNIASQSTPAPTA